MAICWKLQLISRHQRLVPPEGNGCFRGQPQCVHLQTFTGISPLEVPWAQIFLPTPSLLQSGHKHGRRLKESWLFATKISTNTGWIQVNARFPGPLPTFSLWKGLQENGKAWGNCWARGKLMMNLPYFLNDWKYGAVRLSHSGVAYQWLDVWHKYLYVQISENLTDDLKGLKAMICCNLSNSIAGNNVTLMHWLLNIG